MQLVWQPYLSKTRLLCVRNSRGGPSINTRGTPGAAVCLPQEPLYLVGGSDSLRHLGGGQRGGLGCTWPRVPGGGSGGWESDREQGSGLGPNPHSQPSAGRRGSGPWVCCPPALKGEAGTDVSLNQKITLAPRWAALWRRVPPTTLCQGLSVWRAAKGGRWGLWHQRGTWCSIITHWSANQGVGRGPPTQDEGQATPLAFPCPAAKSPMLRTKGLTPRFSVPNQLPAGCSSSPPEDREALPDAPLQPLP